MTAFVEGILSIVPVGKKVWWIGGLFMSGALAGVGFVSATSEISELPGIVADSVQPAIVALQIDVTHNTASIGELQARVEEDAEVTATSLRRIGCLVEITALGEIVLAQQLSTRCP